MMNGRRLQEGKFARMFHRIESLGFFYAATHSSIRGETKWRRLSIFLDLSEVREDERVGQSERVGASLFARLG